MDSTHTDTPDAPPRSALGTPLSAAAEARATARAASHPPAPIDIRRAVLSVFFRAGGGPLTIGEVVSRTRDEAGLDLAGLSGVQPRQRVSDILRYQVRAGRAEAVGRGSYRLFTGRFNEATRRRCLHWQLAMDRRRSFPRWVSLGRTVP